MGGWLKNTTMPVVLVTGGGSALAQAIAAALRSDGATVRLTHRPGTESADGSVACDLGDIPATEALCEGVDQLVHVEPVLEHARDDGWIGPAGWLEVCTTQTYNLLYAAAEAGAVSCCCLSTMALWEGYPADLAIQPFWEPLPTCEPDVLGPHLASYIATQFAHSGALRVSLACLGTLDDLPAGPRCRWRSETGAVAAAVAELVGDTLEAEAEVTGDGSQAPPNIYHPAEKR